MIEYSSCRSRYSCGGDTVPLHLGEKEVIVEVHVQHILLPSVVTDDEAVVAARHQAHGVHLGHGHVLPAYGSAGGRVGSQLHVLRIIRQVVDGGILQQGIVVIHIPVVSHDPEGEVIHIHVLTHHVLQHDTQLVGILGE